MSIVLNPYSQEELFEVFSRETGSINKHLLIIYSLAIGGNAQRALELGIGDTTRALRAAMQQTGGKLFSCDIDRKRFDPLLDQVDSQWELLLEPSESFLKKMDPPFDFVLHDAAHNYWQVRQDLRLILPMMRQFGLICIHDTQHSAIGNEMPKAVRDGSKEHKVSWVHLPFSYGLTILRVEESLHPPLASPWSNSRGATTCCWPDPMVPTADTMSKVPLFGLTWMRWAARRLRRGLKG